MCVKIEHSLSMVYILFNLSLMQGTMLCTKIAEGQSQSVLMEFISWCLTPAAQQSSFGRLQLLSRLSLGLFLVRDKLRLQKCPRMALDADPASHHSHSETQVSPLKG